MLSRNEVEDLCLKIIAILLIPVLIYLIVEEIQPKAVTEPTVVTEPAIITEENILTAQQEILNSSEQLEVLYLEHSKTYMDYRAITNKNSKQYELLQELIYTDEGYLETDDGYKAVALGSYFGDIGQKYIFELTGGKLLKVIKVDEKSDNHTKDGYITVSDGSVIEFIVNSKIMHKGSNGMPYNGNFNNNDLFNGQIQNIYKIGG